MIWTTRFAESAVGTMSSRVWVELQTLRVASCEAARRAAGHDEVQGVALGLMGRSWRWGGLRGLAHTPERPAVPASVKGEREVQPEVYDAEGDVMDRPAAA